MKRRDFLKSGLASLVLLKTAPIAAMTGDNAVKKVIWIFLRGAMDSLDTVIPRADSAYLQLRPNHWQRHELEKHRLNNMFSLHPALEFSHQLYKKKQMAPVVAVASGYRSRSHFEAQDTMESGLNEVDHDQGWLARALGQYSGNALSISRTTPMALKGGPSMPQTWYPSGLTAAESDTLSRLQSMYANDALLSATINTAIEQRDAPMMDKERKNRPDFAFLANRCGEIMADDPQIACAMLEMGGWDTHNNQKNRLTRQFNTFDDGITSLHSTLGHQWKDTLIFVSTEFGRTVKLNGTKGTDHGTGGAMLVYGGALQNFTKISGGKVHGQWPGLNQLLDNRDLNPTSDVREWLGKGIAEHWSLSPQSLGKVFPDNF